MICNLHTHTSFCDGANTAEEMVISAMEKGFCSLGFSSHGYTAFDESYCLTDEASYISEIKRLKDKYKREIQIYLGLEEDIYGLCDRADYEYIIGSSHYFFADGVYFSADESYDKTAEYIKSTGGNPLAIAESYYSALSDYILKRKPDIVGHFDLITKFDEKYEPLFLGNTEYEKLAEKFLIRSLASDCLFEVNTGAISRGYRTTPYPTGNLMHALSKNGGRVILCSDSHSADTLDAGFDDALHILRDAGFKYRYVLYNNEFRRTEI